MKLWNLINYPNKQIRLDKERDRERERERERERQSNLYFWGKWSELLKLIWFSGSGTPLGHICYQSISYNFDLLYITHRKTNLLDIAVISVPDHQCLTTYVFICPLSRFMLFYVHGFFTFVLNFSFYCPFFLVRICIIYGFLSIWLLTSMVVKFHGRNMFKLLHVFIIKQISALWNSSFQTRFAMPQINFW